MLHLLCRAADCRAQGSHPSTLLLLQRLILGKAAARLRQRSRHLRRRQFANAVMFVNQARAALILYDGKAFQWLSIALKGVSTASSRAQSQGRGN